MPRLGRQSREQHVAVAENRGRARAREEVTEPRSKRRARRDGDEHRVDEPVPPAPGTDDAGKPRRRGSHETPLGATQPRQPHAHAGRECPPPGAPRARREQDTGKRKSGRVPDAVPHAEQNAAGVGHEEKHGDRQGGPTRRRAPPRDPAQDREEQREDGKPRDRAGHHERREARAEHAQEGRLEIRRERPEPVDDVAIEQPAAGERVRHDPLAARVDQCVGPPASRNDEEGDRGGRHRNRAEGAAPAHFGWTRANRVTSRRARVPSRALLPRSRPGRSR